MKSIFKIASVYLVLLSAPLEAQARLPLPLNATKEQLVKEKMDAVAGNPQAAHSVYLYYARTTKTGCESLEWLLMGVRMGHKQSIDQYKTLQKDGVPERWLNDLLELGKERLAKKTKAASQKK